MEISLHPYLPGVQLVQLGRFEDDRGYMARILDEQLFRDVGIPVSFAQVSHSHTKRSGVLRGVFVSLPPAQEAKLVRITRGKMQWVLVDLRPDSGTYGRWGEVLLDGREGNAFFAPKGFAHACLCLEEETDLILMADCPYSPAHSSGIRWDDPDLSIGWRLAEAGPLQISEAHLAYRSFANFVEGITVAGNGGVQTS
ncbi:MAG: dTDP-4-dehydrorhamnose 3,5-epimerase family protein [Verrucomicrobiae bacterium]